MNFSQGRKFALVLLALAALALVVPASAQDGTSTTTNTITVSGSGTAYAAPDIAFVSLGVQTTDPDLATAFSQTGNKIAAVLKALQDLGIAKEDIQTSGVNVSPQNQYDQQGNPSQTPVYQVSNTVQVTVRKIDQVESVLTSAVSAGANTIYNLNFGLANSDAVEQQARKAAVDQAKSRAQQLADELGVTLGKPVSISEVPASTPIPFAASNVAMLAAAPSASQPVSTGQLSVTVDIQVTFSFS